MKNKYKHTKTTVSLINYHIVFCPRYRRKIFNIPGVEDRFKELTAIECEKNNIDILAMECHVDHVHMFISVYPQQAIPDVVKQIKGATSHKLREEFPQLENMPSLLWVVINKNIDFKLSIKLFYNSTFIKFSCF